MSTYSQSSSPASKLFGVDFNNISFTSSSPASINYGINLGMFNSTSNAGSNNLGGYMGQVASDAGLGYNSVTGEVFRTQNYGSGSGGVPSITTNSSSSGLDKALQYLSNQKSNTTAGAVLSGIGKLGSGIKQTITAKQNGTSVQGGVGNILGAVGDLGSTFMPEKTEYDGTKGSTTQTLDNVYDGISDALMMVPGWGQLAGGIMKLGKFVGQGVNALGGGTDGMTNTDAILGSSFLNLTPLGLINGFGGKKTDTISKDYEAFANVGSSYTGSYNTIDDAVTKSGKKYGFFSSGARKDANKEIAEATRQQNIIKDISDQVVDQRALLASMSAINSNRRMLNLLGGYDQTGIRVGREGMSLELLKSNIHKLKKYQYGGMIESGIIPQDAPPLDIEDMIRNQLSTQTPNFVERLRNSDYRAIHIPKQGYGNVYVTTFDNRVVPQVQEINGELQYFDDPKEAAKNAFDSGDYLQFENSEQANWFAEHYKELPEFKDYFDKWQNRLVPQISIDDYLEEYFKEKPLKRKYGGIIPVKCDIELINPETLNSSISMINPNEIEEFKEGGSINVIPDGALHARLHHMEDADNLTKKGIPVIDNNGEQQAEVECGEIILNLEVTKTLEKLSKKYYDEESSQKEKDLYALEAGQLLVDEILNNTQDNTNQLL